MSKRTEVKTTMTDKRFVIEAFKREGLQYEEMSDTVLRITSGTLEHATLDLTTGILTGDSDYGHRPSSIGKLNRHYSEALARFRAMRNGAQIQSCKEEKVQVNVHGRMVEQTQVRLHCRMVATA
jgi:hypothetical protein